MVRNSTPSRTYMAQSYNQNMRFEVFHIPLQITFQSFLHSDMVHLWVYLLRQDKVEAENLLLIHLLLCMHSVYLSDKHQYRHPILLLVLYH